MRVALGANQAGKAIARLTPDAPAGVGILLVQHDAERYVKRPEPALDQVVVQLLDAWLVADCRIRVLRARPGIRGIDAAFAVDVVQALGLGVIRLQLLVADRPRRRAAA